jgi:serine/threonine protein kinase
VLLVSYGFHFVLFALLLYRLIVSNSQLTIEFIINYYLTIIGDLKPENLLFTSKENDATLKLCDFGFAKEGGEMNELNELTTVLFFKETMSYNH